MIVALCDSFYVRERITCLIFSSMALGRCQLSLEFSQILQADTLSDNALKISEKG